MMNRELSQRIIFGFSMAAAVAAILGLANNFSFFQIIAVLVALIVVTRSIFEFISFSKETRSASFFDCFFFLPPIAAVVSLLTYQPLLQQLGIFLMAIWIAGGVVGVNANRQAKGNHIRAEDFTAFLLLAIGGGSVVLLSGMPLALLWLIFVCALNDTAAFFGGRFFSGPLLSPVLSPKKTWSGAICGLIAAIIGGGLLANLLQVPGSPEGIFFLTVILGVAGQIGDLSKSLLKRCAGVKDSSNLIPGHGGMLDRVDSLLGSSPILMAYLVIYLPFS